MKQKFMKEQLHLAQPITAAAERRRINCLFRSLFQRRGLVAFSAPFSEPHPHDPSHKTNTLHHMCLIMCSPYILHAKPERAIANYEVESTPELTRSESSIMPA
jgi:hypothetical protein